MSCLMQYHKPDPPVATKLPSIHLSAKPQLGTLLPIALRSPDITIREFKTALHSCYLTALEECYSVEDLRTWKDYMSKM